VLPVKINDKVIAVLDKDSTAFNRFNEIDEAGLMAIVGTMEQQLAQCLSQDLL
jgi:GAF domain-containing protein